MHYSRQEVEGRRTAKHPNWRAVFRNYYVNVGGPKVGE